MKNNKYKFKMTIMLPYQSAIFKSNKQDDLFFKKLDDAHNKNISNLHISPNLFKLCYSPTKM